MTQCIFIYVMLIILLGKDALISGLSVYKSANARHNRMNNINSIIINITLKQIMFLLKANLIVHSFVGFGLSHCCDLELSYQYTITKPFD